MDMRGKRESGAGGGGADRSLSSARSKRDSSATESTDDRLFGGVAGSISLEQVATVSLDAAVAALLASPEVARLGIFLAPQDRRMIHTLGSSLAELVASHVADIHAELAQEDAVARAAAAASLSGAPARSPRSPHNSSPKSGKSGKSARPSPSRSSARKRQDKRRSDAPRPAAAPAADHDAHDAAPRPPAPTVSPERLAAAVDAIVDELLGPACRPLGLLQFDGLDDAVATVETALRGADLHLEAVDLKLLSLAAKPQAWQVGSWPIEPMPERPGAASPDSDGAQQSPEQWEATHVPQPEPTTGVPPAVTAAVSLAVLRACMRAAPQPVPRLPGLPYLDWLAARFSTTARVPIPVIPLVSAGLTTGAKFRQRRVWLVPRTPKANLLSVVPDVYAAFGAALADRMGAAFGIASPANGYLPAKLDSLDGVVSLLDEAAVAVASPPVRAPPRPGPALKLWVEAEPDAAYIARIRRYDVSGAASCGLLPTGVGSNSSSSKTQLRSAADLLSVYKSKVLNTDAVTGIIQPFATADDDGYALTAADPGFCVAVSTAPGAATSPASATSMSPRFADDDHALVRVRSSGGTSSNASVASNRSTSGSRRRRKPSSRAVGHDEPASPRSPVTPTSPMSSKSRRSRRARKSAAASIVDGAPPPKISAPPPLSNLARDAKAQTGTAPDEPAALFGRSTKHPRNRRHVVAPSHATAGTNWSQPEHQVQVANKYSVVTLTLASCATVSALMRTVAELHERGRSVALDLGPDQIASGNGPELMELAAAAGVDYVVLGALSDPHAAAAYARLLDIATAADAM
ncbi:uncharacterized protein AMSG_06485 [Thecamonas trahens ATCC 50062]|uniref:Uncharacterized protein n=1 Tax=Thecamonas trahens ATCC 50062 TaxID=461836 RepID=A0A0L0DFR6_THETB|nr:hypothetical protein AMSG_06485 [Thecamonas trahens ATCC 50062]KNC51134.1 hypothetical protein AMSG_06485 [Thecamonas trahens ATCC 50062]|eukprot:XP_013756340.1 hypothetical protein AMSG_06485 [Thecamonas trahens ATCC 50062]